jgi:hypothetical protein
MPRAIRFVLPALVCAALPAGAALHPAAVPNGTNALGNTVYCATHGTTGTEFCLNNLDAAGVGFNATTAAAPVGGNPGTTVGEQRINAYIEAFLIWGEQLSTPVTVWVQGTFGPLACTQNSGTLGAAGTIQIFAAGGFNGGGALWPSTWYHSALVNRLVGGDVAPGSPDPGITAAPFADDIVSFFNGNLGTPGCLQALRWYYGFDNNESAVQIDFLSVLLHEVGHGLGHANFIDENGAPNGCVNSGNCLQLPGAGPNGLPDIYTVFSKENAQGGKHWNQMSNGERVASATSNSLVWDGPNVHTAAPGWLIGPTFVRENSPTSADFAANPAAYGPLPSFPGTTADVVLVDDGVVGAGTPPGTVNDGCETPFANAAAVAGKIALVDRGLCGFVVKSANAQAAGAVGVIVANNVAEGFPGMGGVLPGATIVGVTQATGNALKSDLGLGAVNATILADSSLGLQGADADGHVKLFAPATFQQGSSVSHWDVSTFRNTMMEPAINSDLRTQDTLDLSPSQMDDIGWDGDVDCPTNSDPDPTIAIDGCDTGVANDFGPWTIFPEAGAKGKKTSGDINAGCYLADLFHGCVGSGSHGDFVSCSTITANELVKLGAISTADQEAILTCVESADLP